MSKFKDKFQLTLEQSLFLAKTKWGENVYCVMKMENRAVTFTQTLTILNGMNVPNVQLDDIQAILNMLTDKYMEQLNTLLLNYYNAGESEELKQFLYENAIQGITI